MVDASLRATILEIITRLKNEGISFLYITHDLSTAYHLADELIVLLDGETVERGPARSVIDDPQHSYTRLLVDSVPVPDPDVRWDEPATGGQASGDSGLDARSPAGAAPRAVSARALIFPFSLNTHQKGRRDAR
jgi:ABC-type oligopeptide transport system ATPase subunit